MNLWKEGGDMDADKYLDKLIFVNFHDEIWIIMKDNVGVVVSSVR